MSDFLVFVNPKRFNYKGEFCYEFIFSDRLDIAVDDTWEVSPSACTEVIPPSEDYITTVLDVTSKDIEFTSASKSDYFCMLDALDDIIALAYETYQPDDGLVKRLVFHYGDDIKTVRDKLKDRKIKFNEIKVSDE